MLRDTQSKQNETNSSRDLLGSSDNRPSFTSQVKPQVTPPDVGPQVITEATQNPSGFSDSLIGDGVHPTEVAKVTLGMDQAQAENLHTSGMTMPSPPLSPGVNVNGDVVDERRDQAKSYRDAVLSGNIPDNLEIAPGVSVGRFSESTNGISAKGHEKDMRRLVLGNINTGDVSNDSTPPTGPAFLQTAITVNKETEGKVDSKSGESGENSPPIKP
jgi:hypothetical protein